MLKILDAKRNREIQIKDLNIIFSSWTLKGQPIEILIQFFNIYL